MSASTRSQAPSLMRPTFTTMSTSRAPSITARAASAAFTSLCTAPEGNPHTVATTRSPVSASGSADGDTHTASTPSSRASATSPAKAAEEDSGLSSVWSIRAARSAAVAAWVIVSPRSRVGVRRSVMQEAARGADVCAHHRTRCGWRGSAHAVEDHGTAALRRVAVDDRRSVQDVDGSLEALRIVRVEGEERFSRLDRLAHRLVDLDARTGLDGVALEG